MPYGQRESHNFHRGEIVMEGRCPRIASAGAGAPSPDARCALPACTLLKPEDTGRVLPAVTTPQRLAVSAVTMLILGLGAFGYSEYNARLAAEARLRELQAELAQRRATQIATPPAPAVSTPEPTAPASAENGPEPVVVSNADSGPPLPMSRGGPGGDWAAIMESPEVQQLMSLRARGQLDGRYAALFAKLRLSPAQLERLQQLLVDKQNTQRDVAAAMRSQGLSTRRDNADQMRSLVQTANTEIDNQIRTELGEAVYAQYLEYERTQSQRSFVDRVQQRLSYTGEALNEQQATGLVSVLAQASTTGTSTNRGPFGGRGGGNVTLTDETIAQASAFLSGSQLKALQELQREQQAQAELARRARENLNNRRTAGSGAP